MNQFEAMNQRDECFWVQDAKLKGIDNPESRMCDPDSKIVCVPCRRNYHKGN